MMTHLLRHFRADVRYEVIASSDLIAWQVIATDPGTLGGQALVEDPSPATHRFLRLRVTRR